MAAIGTMEWALSTGGRMSRSDRFGQLAQAGGVRAGLLLRRFLPKRSAARIDLDALVVPDSAIATEAAELCIASSSQSLANHCLRTFYWGSLLAQAGGLRFDPELFWVASLLHDLGLTDAFGFKDDRYQCFAFEGAVAAGEFASEQGWSDDRAGALSEAICLHLNVKVSVADGPEAYLLRSGSGLDSVGGRLHEINPANRDEVLARYPRLHFKDELSDLAGEQGRRRPQSRMGFLMANGFGGLVQRAPFPD
ncbi:MAG: HD domain-containing protein [Acidimicrobiia bacterium]